MRNDGPFDRRATGPDGGVAPITVEGVRKSLGGIERLGPIDLSIAPGEVTALMGPNGAGKTVLLACLAGGLQPDDGTVLIDPDDRFDPQTATDEENKWIDRTAMAYAPQGSMALPGLTGRETIDFYTSLHPAATDRWRELVEAFGIESVLDELVRTYSGGMTQLLELAIVLSIDASVYLLDEPTAALDMAAIRRLHAAIYDRIEAGATVLCTSHVPADIELADRIVFLREGSIVADGTVEQLWETLPPIVRRADLGRSDEPPVLGGRWMRHADGLCGFLPPDVETDAPTIEPTPGDLFEYYTSIRPASEASGGVNIDDRSSRSTDDRPSRSTADRSSRSTADRPSNVSRSDGRIIETDPSGGVR